MTETSVRYDEYACYEITWNAGLLEEIGGCGLDDFCDSNKACFNTADEYCVNTNACFENLGCIENVGCTN